MPPCPGRVYAGQVPLLTAARRACAGSWPCACRCWPGRRRRHPASVVVAAGIDLERTRCALSLQWLPPVGRGTTALWRTGTKPRAEREGFPPPKAQSPTDEASKARPWGRDPQGRRDWPRYIVIPRPLSVLRAGANAQRLCRTRWLDPTPPADVPLEAVETRRHAAPRTSCPTAPGVGRAAIRPLSQGLLADSAWPHEWCPGSGLLALSGAHQPNRALRDPSGSSMNRRMPNGTSGGVGGGGRDAPSSPIPAKTRASAELGGRCPAAPAAPVRLRSPGT